jgi:hypothetical protein
LRASRVGATRDTRSPLHPTGRFEHARKVWSAKSRGLESASRFRPHGNEAQDDFDKDLGRFGVTASELNDAHQRAKTFALTTDILAGSAIVCASIATVLLVTHDSGAEQVGLAIGPGNVTLRGNF